MDRNARGVEWRESPGKVKGQRDVQRCPLEAVFRACGKAGRLSVGLHRNDLQVPGVQSLQADNQAAQLHL